MLANTVSLYTLLNTRPGFFSYIALHSLVVVEKPFTRCSEEADRLLVLAKEKKRILTVYQSIAASPLERLN
jgi:hypothetical protein